MALPSGQLLLLLLLATAPSSGVHAVAVHWPQGGAAVQCEQAAGVDVKRPAHYSETNATDAAGCCADCGADSPRCQYWSFKPSDAAAGVPSTAGSLRNMLWNPQSYINRPQR